MVHNSIFYNVLVRAAVISDIDDLITLNKQWHFDSLKGNISNGYLLDSYNHKDFGDMISKNEVVVGIIDQEIISYYLINSGNRDGSPHRHKNIIHILKEKSIIPIESNVGYGAQALVNEIFQGSELRKLMLAELVKLIKGKYNFLFSTISKENGRAFKAHLKDGWKVIEEDDNLYLVILNLEQFEVF